MKPHAGELGKRLRPSQLTFRAFPAAAVCVALALASLAVVVSAQKKPESAGIRIATRLVRIGVIVRGPSGPVENLKKGDFIILDRGKPRKIAIFSAEAPEPSAPARKSAQTARLAKPLPQGTFSNQPHYGASAPRGVTVVLLDSLNTLAGWLPMGASGNESTPPWFEAHAFGRAKDHLITFLKQMNPEDRVAIYGLGEKLHVLCDFTCSPAELLAVVNKYDARSRITSEQAEPGSSHTSVPHSFNLELDQSAAEQAEQINRQRAQITIGALLSIADHVADIPGRKNLVWLTANLPFSGQVFARILARANMAVYPVDARGLLPRMGSASADLAKPWEQFTDKRVLSASEPPGIPEMEELAADTGGTAYVNTNDITGAIRKAVEDSAVTYTLGFYINSRSVDGKFHKLRIEIKRKGLTLRYPSGYFAYRDSPATQNEDQNNLLAAERSPISSPVIPVEVRLEKVNQPSPDSLKVLGTIDIHGFQFVSRGGFREGTILLATIQQDEAGKILEKSAVKEQVRWTAQQYHRYMKTGVQFRQLLKLKPEATTLRYVLEDLRTGVFGSLIVPLSQVN